MYGRGARKMRERDIEKLIAEALRENPSAPPELRNNVMESIGEYEAARDKRSVIARIFSAGNLKYAGVIAGFAVVVIIGSIVIGNQGKYNGTSSSNTSAADVMTFAASPNTESGDTTMEALPQEARSRSENVDSPGDTFTAGEAYGHLDSDAIESDAEEAIVCDVTIYGELPQALSSLSNVAQPDGSYVFESVPYDLVADLISNGAVLNSTPVGENASVHWIP